MWQRYWKVGVSKTKIIMFQHPEAAPQAQKWRNDRNPGRPILVALSP